MLSRLSAANSHDRLIEEPDNRGPDERGCTVFRSKFGHFKSEQQQLDLRLDLIVFIQS